MGLGRFFLCVMLIAFTPFASAEISMWPVDSLMKVFQDDLPGKNRAPDQAWLIPRNGHASVQFAIRASTPVRAMGVTVKLGGGLVNQVRRVGYVPVRANPPGTPSDEVARSAPGKFPDPLFEDFPFRLEANQTAAVWITIHAPAGATPGVYRGVAIIRSGKQRLASIHFQVRVVSATVPAKQILQVTNWFYLDEDAIGRYYNFDGNHERYWEALGNIGRVMADHKQNAILTPVFSLTEGRSNGASLEYDFRRLDRWVETFRRAGTAQLIEGGHLLDRASAYDSPLKIPAFVVANGMVERQTLNPEDPRAEKHFNSFLPALYAHLRQKGWLGDYVQHV